MAVAYYVNNQGLKVPLPVPVHNHDATYALAGHTHPTDDTGWLPMSYFNDWTDYGGVYETGQYRRHNGIVYLKGLVRRQNNPVTGGGVAAPGTNDITVLPVGFRPLQRHIFLGATQSSAPYKHSARVDVYSEGYVVPQYYNDTDNDTWVSLSNIFFIAEQ